MIEATCRTDLWQLYLVLSLKHRELYVGQAALRQCAHILLSDILDLLLRTHEFQPRALHHLRVVVDGAGRIGLLRAAGRSVGWAGHTMRAIVLGLQLSARVERALHAAIVNRFALVLLLKRMCEYSFNVALVQLDHVCLLLF